jgi:hypothetical protein
MPKFNYYCPSYEGLEKGQKSAPIVCTLAPPSIRICIRQGKNGKWFIKKIICMAIPTNIYQ